MKRLKKNWQKKKLIIIIPILIALITFVFVYKYYNNEDLNELVNYDIVVSATGVPGLIKSNMLKQGAIMVDAGTASEDGILKGDLDEAVREERDDLIVTPRVGGVGPLTVAMLFEQVLRACEKKYN